MAAYSTARHSQCAYSLTPKSSPSLLNFSDPRAGIHSSPRRPLLTLSFRGSARNLGGSVPSITPVLGGRNPSLGGAAHPEQSRRVERGRPRTANSSRPLPSAPICHVIPRLSEGSRTCPITPFLAPIRHSGRREPESIPKGGSLTLSKVEGSSGGRPSSANKSRSPCTSTPAPSHPEAPLGI